MLDAQRRIAELEAAHAAEVARSQRLEQQIGQLLEQLAALTQRVAELTERLGQNSRNSLPCQVRDWFRAVRAAREEPGHPRELTDRERHHEERGGLGARLIARRRFGNGS